MADHDALWKIVGDLVDVSRLQAKQIEKLVKHVEQVATRMPDAEPFAVVVSKLSELEHRPKTTFSTLPSQS